MNNNKKISLKARLVCEDDEKLPCAFCHRNIDNETFYGKLYAIGEIQCHYFCVLLSSCLVQKGKDTEGLLGFKYKDIIAEIDRAKKHKCSYCNREGATLGCSITQCRKQFHLPCGKERNAVSMFFGNYKSFCQTHSPKQKIAEPIMVKARARMSEARKKNRSKVTDLETPIDSQFSASQSMDTGLACVICYEAIEGYPSTNTFWPPCCARDAWFHRSCLERMTLSAGVHFLKCPLCNDKDVFHEAVASQGYYIPDRDAVWELEQNAFSDLYERPITCGATECKCPMGRDYDAEIGDWVIELCLLCGSTGIHAGCGDRPYVCIVCRPAVSEDLETIQKRIRDVILEESRRETQQHGPRMPTRMSLRRTKLRSNIPSSSRTDAEPCNKKKEPLQSLEESRLELNLKSPTETLKRLRGDENACKDSQVAKKSPKKQFYSTIDSEVTSLLRTVIDNANFSPRKLLQNSIEEAYSLKSPIKNLQEVFEKMATAYSTIDKGRLESLRLKLKRPRPMSEKKNIIKRILQDLIRGVLNENKTTKEIKHYISYEKELVTCQSNIVKVENEFKIEEKKEIEETDDKENLENYKQIHFQSTSTPKKNKYLINESETKEKEDEKEETSVIDNNLNTCNDSSNSTFQLPSEFVANNESDDDSLPIFETPKKTKTIDLQNDSMEISKDDKVVNIHVTKVSPENKSVLKQFKGKSPNKSEQCSFKFSTLDKETLEKDNLNIDIESFKNHYLNEVNRQDEYNFNHGQRNSGKNTVALRTVIDYAVDATIRKEIRKRKLVNNDGPSRKVKKIDNVTEDKKEKVKLDSENKSNAKKENKNVNSNSIDKLKIENTNENKSKDRNRDTANVKRESVKLKKSKRDKKLSNQRNVRRKSDIRKTRNVIGDVEIQNLINIDGVTINQKVKLKSKHSNKNIKIKIFNNKRNLKKNGSLRESVKNVVGVKTATDGKIIEKLLREMKDDFVKKIISIPVKKHIKKCKKILQKNTIQTVLSPENVADKILVPTKPVTPLKRNSVKHKKINDNFKQTNIMSFFNKTSIENKL